jgi:NAD(P)-dependent dehydrogenase (short-subunit alcohol dehydrogenase family)
MKPQVTVVTGGSAGIGEAICRQLLERGDSVVNIDIKAPVIEAPNYRFIQADLSDRLATRDAARQAAETFEVLRLVNNAGATRPARLEDATDEDLDFVVNLQLRASLIMTQAFTPAMRKAGHGRIVNMASRTVLGKAERTVYSATKAGLVAFTRTWAMELGAQGITVNAIAPGPIATDLFEKSNPPGAPQTQRIIDSILVKRLGTPQDIARSALFFLAPEAGFITGQVLYVCGGTTLGVAPI